MTSMDKDAIAAAYEDVRNDSSDTQWLLITYSDDNKKMELNSTGTDYNEVLGKITDDTRCYIFVRVETGDEMSKRAKFALMTFVGEGVSPLKKAKVSTDKSEVKNVIRNFAVEQLATEKGELSYDAIKTACIKSGGANYGTGK